MGKLDQLLQEIRTELGSDFISTSVTGSDGMAIAAANVDPNADLDSAVARLAVMMKLTTKVSDKLGTGEVVDNLVTTDTMYLITRYLGHNESYFLGIAVTRNAILGTVRLLMNEYADQIWDAIPR